MARAFLRSDRRDRFLSVSLSNGEKRTEKRTSSRKSRPFDAGVEQAYRNWLFHGPLLQGIRRIEGLGARGVEAILEPSPPDRCMRGVGGSRWLIDPVVFDSALQLFLVWARSNLDKTPLPSRFAGFRRYAAIVHCYLDVLDKSRDPVFYIDLHFVGPDGRLLWVLEGMEGVCTRALNRLGGSWLLPKSGLELSKGSRELGAVGRS